MKTIIIIRPASSSDSDALALLAGQLGYPSTPEQIVERLYRIENNPAHKVFVAVSGNLVIGWAHISIELHLESGAFAELVGLVVNEHYRDKGAGSLLLDAAEQWAQEQGFNELRLRTNILRERTHKFYERHGYILKKQQKVYHKILIPPLGGTSKD